MLELEDPTITPKVRRGRGANLFSSRVPGRVLEINECANFVFYIFTRTFKIATALPLLQMVDFLLQDGVPEVLLSFVTQVGKGTVRPGPTDPKTDAMKLSYK